VGISSGDVGAVRHAHAHSSAVARLRQIFELPAPWCAFACGEHLRGLRIRVAPEVVLGQLLHKLRVVEFLRSRLLDRLLGDSLGAAALDVGAWLFGLARGTVDDVTAYGAAGLHGCDAGEDLEDLLMARVRDLAVEQELMHRDGGVSWAGETRAIEGQ
jgi:hypothetical protein